MVSKKKSMEDNTGVYLMMECQEDNLSLAQISAYKKREEDYAAACRTQQVFKNNGDVLYENGSIIMSCMKTNTDSSHNLEITPDKEIFLNCVSTSSFSDRQLKIPASLLTTTLMKNKVGNPSKTSVLNAEHNGMDYNTSLSTESFKKMLPLKDKYYQLVMDTKLGLIINGRLGNNDLSDGNSNITNLVISLNAKDNPLIKPITTSQPLTGINPSVPDNCSAVSKNQTVQNTFTVVPSFEFKDDNGTKSTFMRSLSPSLFVIARPYLLMKNISRKIANEEQLRLDVKVKFLLTLGRSKFTEWLLKQGLILSEQFCPLHGRVVKTNEVKLKLGMYSDKTKFIFSGGYVWVSDCCPKNIISVFRNTIFEGPPYEPSILLKLLYHWSCQTNAQYVVEWVKVSNTFLKQFYSVLRAVCTAAIHEEYKELLGGKRKMVEVGIISLEAVSEGNVKRTKVWILGAMESESKRLRLHVIDPVHSSEPESVKKKMLRPLVQSVHKDSVILTDQTLDKNLFIGMGYHNVFHTPIQTRNTKNTYSSENIMEYLKSSVPRMFQTTLALLSKQVIQQFLDELTWREKWGPTASRAFYSIINFIQKQTKIDASNSLYISLSKIALYPFMNWQYDKWKINFNLLNRNSHDQTNAASKNLTSVLLKKQNNLPESKCIIPATAITPSTVLKTENRQAASASGKIVPTDLKKLENYYYGQLDGKKQLLDLEIKCNLHMKCVLCCKTMNTNINMMEHIITHALNTYINNNDKNKKWCRYCLKEFNNDESLKNHIDDVHVKMLKLNRCLVCEIDFKYNTKLILHMHCYHNEVEMPYECSICKFRSSEHRNVVDHFYEKHNHGEKAQCPLCLKIVAFKDKAKKITQNIYFFLNHIRKHFCKKLVKKCNRCVLSFINKGVLDYHQRTQHKSCKDIPHVKRYDNSNTVWMPPPSSGPMTEKLQAQKISENLNNYFTQDVFDVKIIINETDEYACCECEGYILEEGHFPGNLNCHACSFKTCCEKSMIEHVVKFHDNASKKSCNVERQTILNKPMYCMCGFESVCGNKLADHAVQCKKKTMYSLKRIFCENECKPDVASTTECADKHYGLHDNSNGQMFPEYETEQCMDLPQSKNNKMISNSDETLKVSNTLINTENSQNTAIAQLNNNFKKKITRENESADEHADEADEPPTKKPKLIESKLNEDFK